MTVRVCIHGCVLCRDEAAICIAKTQAAFVAVPLGGHMPCFILLLIYPRELATPREQIPPGSP